MLIGGSSSPGAGAQVTASRLSLHRYSEWARSTAKTRFHCRMPPPTFCGEKGRGHGPSGMLAEGSIHPALTAGLGLGLRWEVAGAGGGVPAYLSLFGEDLLAVEPALLPHGAERDVREVGG